MRLSMRCMFLYGIVIAVIVVHTLWRFIAFRQTNRYLAQDYNKEDSVYTAFELQILLNELPTIKEHHLKPPKVTNDSSTIAIFIYRNKTSGQYETAHNTVQCYANMHGYKLVVQYDEDRDMKACQQKYIYFRKHCAVAKFLASHPEFSWVFVLDADTAVVNPVVRLQTYLEEYKHTETDLIFYERFHNWEIMAGNYIVRRSSVAINFLYSWASYEQVLPQGFSNFDNGALHLHILKTVLGGEAPHRVKLCEKLWHITNREVPIDSSHYFEFITCVQSALGAKRRWGKIAIRSRAHGWAIDRKATGDRWCSRMFMMHGVKDTLPVLQNKKWLLKKSPDPSKCEYRIVDLSQWHYNTKLQLTCDHVRTLLAVRERDAPFRLYNRQSRVATHLRYPQVGLCWPDCA